MENLEEVGGGSGNGVELLTAACPKAFYSSLGSVYWIGGFSLMLQGKKAEKQCNLRSLLIFEISA